MQMRIDQEWQIYAHYIIPRGSKRQVEQLTGNMLPCIRISGELPLYDIVRSKLAPSMSPLPVNILYRAVTPCVYKWIHLFIIF